MNKRGSLSLNLFFFFMAWLWIAVMPVKGESLKCKSETDTDIFEMQQVAELYCGYYTRVGSVNCENGETAKWTSYGNFGYTLDAGGFAQEYIIMTFKGGAQIVVRSIRPSRADPSGKMQWVWDYTCEILTGDGRFRGIRGSVSISGRQLFNPKKTQMQEMTFTYTIPSK